MTTPGNRTTLYTLTYCRTSETLYGNTLLFKTLRVGFPTATVRVVDNHSTPEAASHIQRLCKDNDCEFLELAASTPYHWIRDLILEPTLHGTVVFVHPDICFWKNCENWSFDKLIAGRLIPMHRNEVTGWIMMPLLHSSFLWIEDIDQLRSRYLREYHLSEIERLDAFLPYMFKHEEEWYKFDAAANLYAALRDEVYCFGEKELDSFDHLFAGTYLDAISQSMNDRDRQRILEIHAAARDDFRRLKGIWKEQERYFRQRAIGLAAPCF